MSKRTLIGGCSAVALMAVIAAATPASAQQYYGNGWYGGGMMGPGMMGPGMMGSYGMMGPGMMGGYGMMGPGYCPGCGPGMMGNGMMGPGMMGWGYGAPQGYAPQQANLNLSTNDVKSYLDRWITMMGNPHLKAGRVAEKDANTITAEIVTADKADLVQRFNIDRRTGFWQPAQ